MTATIQKWGNSLAIRLPKSLADEKSFATGTVVELRASGDGIELRPVKPKVTLAQLLKACRRRSGHAEVDYGDARGSEIW